MHVRLRRILCTSALAAAAACTPAWAQIYGGSGSNGVVVLSNFATDETPVLVVDKPAEFRAAEPLQVATSLPASQLQPVAPAIVDPRDPAASYRSLIDKVAKETALSPQLLHAVIRVESGYRADAVSPRGAVGLMQLMPATAQRFGVRDAFDPQQNIRGGAQYLKWLLEYFRGDLRLALAAYNAGEAAVVRAGYRVPAIAETVTYVPKVLWYLSRANG